jgi:hypothetical protein
MINSAAPSTAIAISPAEYFVLFFAGGFCGCEPFCFFFLRGFFDMSQSFYPKVLAAGHYGFKGRWPYGMESNARAVLPRAGWWGKPIGRAAQLGIGEANQRTD